MSSDSCRLRCRILIRVLFGLNVLVVGCDAFRREKNKTDYKSIGEELGPSRSYHTLIKLPSFKMGVNDECLYVCLFVLACEMHLRITNNKEHKFSLSLTFLSFKTRIEWPPERERKTGLFVKSHRSKILNYVIIYKLQIYKYKYDSLKFY